MKRTFVLAAFAVLFTLSAHAAGNIGFIQGNIWYSPDPFFLGQTVRLYSAVFNGSSNDIVGTVEFYADAAPIGTTNFTAASGGKLQEVWVDWKAVGGDHTISAKIIRAAISRAGQPDEPIAVANAVSGESVRFIDADTDGDGIGDRQDTKDDRQSTLKVVDDATGAGLPSPGAVTEAAKPLADAAAVAAASVSETIDATSSKLRPVLEAKKSELEKEIEAIKQKENTFVHTEEGARINVATGDDTVVPSRPASTPTDTLKRIGKQLFLLAVIAALYILDHKIILYIVLALIAYKLIRFIFRLFVSRRASY